MSALDNLKTRLKDYDMSQYVYDPLLDPFENRGLFLASRIAQMIGEYIEEVIPEWDPDPEAKHLGKGCKTDWENSKIVVEQKKNPATDNSSSKKANNVKLKESAAEKNKTPIYAYWEDRKKNDYMKDGIRHLHGIAIFKYLGVEDKWGDFISHVNDVKIIIRDELKNKYNEHYESFVVPTV
jgi:hypothetical protein